MILLLEVFSFGEWYNVITPLMKASSIYRRVEKCSKDQKR